MTPVPNVAVPHEPELCAEFASLYQLYNENAYVMKSPDSRIIHALTVSDKYSACTGVPS